MKRSGNPSDGIALPRGSPNESLKVQNEVGLEVRYFAAPADKFYDSARASKPTSGKWDYGFEIGIVLKERPPFGVSNPVEIGVAKSRFQEMDRRKGVNNITKRAWLDNEHRRRRHFPKARRSANRGGRPEARIFSCALGKSYRSRRS